VVEPAGELLAVLALHVAPQVEVARQPRQRQARRLEHPGGHDVVHAAGDRHLAGVALVQHERGRVPGATDGERVDRGQQRPAGQVERVADEGCGTAAAASPAALAVALLLLPAVVLVLALWWGDTLRERDRRRQGPDR
jgi:hypothetical protein